MLSLNHKNLDIYKVSKKLIKEVYSLIENFPKSEIFGLTNQLRRASVSVISNISEGCAKKSLIERNRYLETARASLVEIDAQLEVAIELNFIKEVQLTKLNEYILEVFAKLSKLIRANNSQK